MTTTTTWTCWRDPAHTSILTHPLGWPQCAECGAAPAYHERGQYLPERFTLTVYVPVDENTYGIKERSGIVGVSTLPESGLDNVLAYYEGWANGAMQYADRDTRGQWEAGLLHAADRMVTAYPTISRIVLSSNCLKAIGTYNPWTREVLVEDEAALAEWLA